MTCGIYRIVNKLNGKCYVGQSVDIERRFREHNWEYQSYVGSPFRKLYDALHKYGVHNFESELLELCLPKELNEREVYWINHFNSLNQGYNMTIGGEGFGVGEDNPCAKLSGQEVSQIKSLLSTSTKSLKGIAKMFDNCTEDMVSQINLGITWSYVDNYTYPIRQTKPGNWCETCGARVSWNESRCKDCYSKSIRGEDGVNVKLKEVQVRDIIYLLKKGTLSMDKIAEQFRISKGTVSSINRGENWGWLGEVEGHTYPIRTYYSTTSTCRECGIKVTYGAELCRECNLKRYKGENNPKSNISEEEVSEVKRMLRDRPDLSMKRISKILEISYYSVKDINIGRTWVHVDKDTYTYPIR